MAKRARSHVDNPARVGKRIHEARARAGLSQRDLAFTGCTAAYISRIEAGDRVPSLKTLHGIAKRLGVSAEFLATGADASLHESEPLLEAEIAARIGDPAIAEGQFEAALRQATDSRSRGRALAGLAQLTFGRGEHTEAIAQFQAALEEDPGLEEKPLVADSLGRAYALSGQYESAIALFERRLEDAEKRGDLLETVRFAVLLANTLIDCGALGRADELLGHALAQTHEHGDPLIRVRLWWSQSRLHASRNDPQTAARYARLALSVLELSEHSSYTARAYQLLANIELDRGNAEEALALLEKGLPLIVASGNRFEEAVFRLDQARALAELDRREEAAALAMQIGPLLSQASPADAGRAYFLLGQVYEALGEVERAIELCELAAETIPPADRHLSQVYARLGKLFRRQGRKDDALDAFSKSVALNPSIAGERIPQR